MPVPRATLVIAGIGLVTFVLVFSLMEFSPSRAAPTPSVVVSPALGQTRVLQVATDSVARNLQAGHEAVGVPVDASSGEALLREVQPGDRLDVLASLAFSEGATPLTAVVVHGATVLRPPTAADPLLLEVTASDAIVLAHLVLGGTHLGYMLWPASGMPASLPLALDERNARALLGLALTPTARPAGSTPTPIVVTSPTMPPVPDSGFLYQAQPGDSWDGIAAIFGISVGKLRQWNEAAADADPVPGRLIFIPRPS